MKHRLRLHSAQALPETAPQDVLRMIEGFGLTGHWTWDFIEDRHVWSPGLHQICGVSAGAVAADYGLLFRLIHPDDRPASMEPGFLRQAGVLTTATFRIVRPDSAIRTVISQGQVSVSPEGRPLSARGVLVDVSDRDVLTRAMAAQNRQKRVVFETLGAFTSTTTIYPFQSFSQEWLDLVGLPMDELVADPTKPIVKDQRQYWREHGRALYLSRRIVHTEPTLVLSNGDVVPYRMVMIPLFKPSGAVDSWTNYVGPVHLPVRATGQLKRGLEQLIEGAHLRAARALLDWSMMDLAKASGLSFAVIRRLEGGGDPSPGPALHGAVEALRQAGILFSLIEGATVVVGKAR